MPRIGVPPSGGGGDASKVNALLLYAPPTPDFAFRSLARALVVMAPVVATAVVIFGAMGYAGLPLGIATSMFASLAVGVGVTFGIYYFWFIAQMMKFQMQHITVREV